MTIQNMMGMMMKNTEYAPSFDDYEKLDKQIDKCPKCSEKLEGDFVCLGYQINGNWMRCWTCDSGMEYICEACGWKGVTSDTLVLIVDNKPDEKSIRVPKTSRVRRVKRKFKKG